jgi:hypothetical protein
MWLTGGQAVGRDIGGIGPLQMCRYGALAGARLATFCAGVLCDEAEHGSAVLARALFAGAQVQIQEGSCASPARRGKK